LAIEPSVWDSTPIGNYIVFEIPTFMFFTIYTAIIYLWVTVVLTVARMGRKAAVARFRIAYILFNGGMFFVFAIFILIFSLSPSTASDFAQCNLGALAVTPSFSRSQRSVSLAYNIVIAIICFTLSIAFLISGILLIKPVIHSNIVNKKKKSSFNLVVVRHFPFPPFAF